ncbi:MAG: DnaD domain protein [Acholeplasmataceae bacterium]|nr:DnaD domain protein [Acholeplasmataceae bacterium]
MLKRLYEEYDLSMERILIKEYKRLKLTMQEMTVLLALFSIYKKRRTFSINAINRRVEYSINEIGSIIEKLLSKGFMTIELEKKDGKEREVFDLNLTFDKIQDLFKADEIEKKEALVETEVSETIKRFEQGLGRLLMPYELEMIRRWYDENKVSHESIIEAIESAQDRMSVKYVEKILTQQVPEKIEIDQDVDQALDEIFKKIK